MGQIGRGCSPGDRTPNSSLCIIMSPHPTHRELFLVAICIEWGEEGDANLAGFRGSV